MRVPGPERWSSRTFWAVIVGMTAAAGLLRLPWVDRGLNENTSFRQTQTAFTVREYMRNGIDLLHAPMPVLGPPWDLPFELPLFQALAAVVGRLGLDSTTAARLTGLVFFQLTCLALAVLALRWFSRATALLTVVLFQLSPFGVQWGSASLIEFLATACSVGALVVVDVWSTRRRPVWLVLAVVLQVLAFLVKPTTAVPWLVAYAVPVARMVLDAPTSRARATVAAWASAPPLAGLVAAVLWTRHADDIKAASPFTEGLTSRSLMTWNFGTPGQRLDPAAWGLVFGRVGSISGSLTVLLLAVVAAIVCWRAALPTLALPLVPVVAAGIFFNLYVRHDYYLAAVYPALVLVLASAATGLLSRLPQRPTRYAVAVVGVVALLALSWSSTPGQEYGKYLRTPVVADPVSGEIAAVTRPGDGVLMVGCDWNPTYLYHADRRGLMWTGAPPVPRRWVPGTLSYVAYCNAARGTVDVLPPGVVEEQVSDNVYRLSAGPVR